MNNELISSTRYSPSQVKQAVLAALKPTFYSGGFYAGATIIVQGEIANDPANYGQTIYFNIKDNTGCLLNVCTFRNSFNFDLSKAKGAKVEVYGMVDLQEKPNNNADFDLLFKAVRVEHLGIGEQAVAELSLSQELDKLGYFNGKRPLPSFDAMEICNIGVITSGSSGANAFADIKQTLNNLPFFNLQLIGVSMFDGSSIAMAIEGADSLSKDILVITRGGGDRLNVFDERPILNAVHKAKTLTICAVGHAKDRLLIEKVADLAAATPSEAGKLLSDHYINCVDKKENNRLKAAFNQLSLQNRSQADSLNQLNKTLSQIQSSLNEKDQLIRDLKVSLEQSKKTNRVLIFVLLGVAAITSLLKLFFK